MPRSRPKEVWEDDTDFCVIASVVWHVDYQLASGKVRAAGGNAKSARTRMNLRYEAYSLADFLENQINDLARAAEALRRSVSKERRLTGKPTA